MTNDHKYWIRHKNKKYVVQKIIDGKQKQIADFPTRALAKEYVKRHNVAAHMEKVVDKEYSFHELYLKFATEKQQGGRNIKTCITKSAGDRYMSHFYNYIKPNFLDCPVHTIGGKKLQEFIDKFLAEGTKPELYKTANLVLANLRRFFKWCSSNEYHKNFQSAMDYRIPEEYEPKDSNLRDPVKATHAACKYLKDLYKLFDNWYLTLAAYNCGEGRVLRASKLHQTYDFWQMHSLPRETRNYIPYFLSAAIIARTPEQYGFKIPKNVEPYRYDVISLEKSADIAVLARVAGIKPNLLRKYNPELRQSATPAEVGYQLKLPYGIKNRFIESWNEIPEEERFAPQFVVHRVRYGESLWTISKKYNVSIHDLAAVNKIRNRNRVRVGQKLNVPLKGGQIWGSRDNGGPRGYTKRIYRVKRGDTLGQIAESFGTRASKIRRWNNLKYGSHLIHPGQKLVIWVK